MGCMVMGADRQNLEQLRDYLSEKINYWQDQVSYGMVSHEEADQALVHEFGEDYYGTLQEVNKMIHEKPRYAHIPHIKPAALLLFIIGAFVVTATLLYPGTTGALISAENTYIVEKTLSGGDAARIAVPVDMLVSQASASYRGTGELLVFIEDRTRKTELLRISPEGLDCLGCGNIFEPPYQISVEGQGGEVTLHSIAFYTT